MTRGTIIKLAAVLAAGALLSGCENDAASFMLDGKDHALTLLREQPYFWSDNANLELVVARLPDCQRRLPMKPAPLPQAQVSIYEVVPTQYQVQQGKNWYLAETQGCTLQTLSAPPETPGKLLGTFDRKDGKLRFLAK
ncbi:MAG: hypothetical protein PHU46_07125 [Rhodocyclaceae bacterium]|nr:hypothetical protein [Rhodocyclaceae bacterium]